MRDPLAGLPRGNDLVLQERHPSIQRAVSRFQRLEIERRMLLTERAAITALSAAMFPPHWTWPTTSFPARPQAPSPRHFVGLDAVLDSAPFCP